ncbi:cytochrome P450 family protein [Actinoplanes derwentensis]|uniref:Cytochrome P450 n=1 Tax=Actinoplanes derwentensis TaxID=113562 RepID=A0A1H2CIG7_9ACTN|nr:cytochrome P450 [Actinoplanes derwentensis]GID90053.1 cytochrome P450 [Actinoplanes derwentensis]SDT70211.1 Cytochrome P450 [Actinoplanes derwentensis]
MADDHSVFTATADGERRRLLLDLAAQGPVHRVTLPSGSPAWLVTGYDEARAALTDSRLMRYAYGGTYAKELPELNRALDQHMLLEDPPEHTRLRKLVAVAFTRRRVEQLEPVVEKISAELIDEVRAALEAGETVDLVSAYAFRFSFRTMCELVGIPASEEQRLGSLFSVLTRGTAAPLEEYRSAGTAMTALIGGLIDERRRGPCGDLLSALVAADDGGDRLSPDELVSMVYLIMVAGHETTAALITNGLLLLLRHPDQLAALRAAPETIGTTIEEILRYDGPVQSTFPSFAVEDFELGGHKISVGDVVTVSPIAASLDRTGPGHPTGFDVTRQSPAHLAFGHGIHYCIGAPLARLEGRIAFRDLLDRLPDLELADEPRTRVPSVIINRLTALPVRQATA